MVKSAAKPEFRHVMARLMFWLDLNSILDTR